MNCEDAFEPVLRRPIGLAEEPLLSFMLPLRERELVGVDMSFPVSFPVATSSRAEVRVPMMMARGRGGQDPESST